MALVESATVGSLDLLEVPAPGLAHGSSAPSGRGKHAGWLLKRKSEGVASRLFRSANRRYFTLDFEGQLFYYTHSESDKTTSLPVAFRNLLSVEPVEAALHDGAAEEQDPAGPVGHSQASKGGERAHPFRVPKISFSALKRPAEHHGFLLRTSGKEMELLCSSKAEAETWITVLREAIALGSEGHEEPLKVELSTSAGSSPEAPLSPRSQSDDSVPEFQVPEAAPEEAVADRRQTSPRNVQAFGAEPLQVEVKEAAAKGARPGRRGLGGLLPRRLGRRSAPEVAAAAEAGVAATAVAFGEGAAVTSLGAEDAEHHAWEEEEDGAAKSTALNSEVSKRYADKGRGLSLKERLAQMDFSDDEDEGEGA